MRPRPAHRPAATAPSVARRRRARRRAARVAVARRAGQRRPRARAVDRDRLGGVARRGDGHADRRAVRGDRRQPAVAGRGRGRRPRRGPARVVALVVNQTRGTLARVDGATFAGGTPVLVADPGSPVTVLEGGDQAYVVDATRRTTAVLDADALTLQATISLSSTPGTGQSAVDDDGRLWVVDSEGSGIASFRGSRPGGAGPADARAQVVLVQGRAVLTDLAGGHLGALGADGRWPAGPAWTCDPTTPCSSSGSATAPRLRRRGADRQRRRRTLDGRLPGRRPGRRRGGPRLRPHGAERPVRLRAGPHHGTHDDHRHGRLHRRHVRADAAGATGWSWPARTGSSSSTTSTAGPRGC